MWSHPHSHGSLSHKQKNQSEDAEDPAVTTHGYREKTPGDPE